PALRVPTRQRPLGPPPPPPPPPALQQEGRRARRKITMRLAALDNPCSRYHSHEPVRQVQVRHLPLPRCARRRGTNHQSRRGPRDRSSAAPRTVLIAR